MKILSLALAPLLLFSAVACSSPGNDPSLVGRWKRSGDNGQWVIYDYRQDGSLFRATQAQHQPAPFGKYRVAEDHIYFEENPDDYTPVRFKIETGTCSGQTGDTLFLYDKETGKAYGCYFRAEAQEE